MASKSKTGTQHAEHTVKNGAEAMSQGFEKAAQGYDQFVAFGKDTAKAWLKSATAAGKHFEAISGEVQAFSRQAIEESVAATKAVLASKSLNETVEIQSDFVKSAFETYVGEMTKLSDLMLNAAKDAAEPLQARATAFVEMVQTARAA